MFNYEVFNMERIHFISFVNDKPHVATLSIKFFLVRTRHIDKVTLLLAKGTWQNHSQIKNQNVTHFEGELVFTFVSKSSSFYKFKKKL